MSFVSFIQATEYGEANLVMPTCVLALTDGDCFRASKIVLVSLSIRVSANLLKRMLSRLTGNFGVDPVAAVFAFARLGENGQTAPDCVGWFLYDVADSAIIFVPEWQGKRLKQGLCGEALSGAAHATAASRYMKGFCDADMSREFVKMVCARYKADGTGLKKIPLLAEQ